MSLVPQKCTCDLIKDGVCPIHGGGFCGSLCRHGIFSQGIQTLTTRFKNVITTDSLPQISDTNLIVVPCADTIKDAILTPEQLWRNGNQS